MKRTLSTLALVCLCVMPYVSAQNTDAASDKIVVVGNPSQPVQWNHKSNIKEAIARAQPNGTVIIPSSYSGTDCSPISSCSPGSVIVIDWRTGGGSSSLACGNSAAVYIFNGTGTVCDPNFLDTNGALTAISLAAQSLTISSSAQFNLGARLGPLTFANLGTPNDGTYVYCLDCQLLDPCLGGGTGAFARRVNSTWLCSAGGGGGGSTTPGGPNTGIQLNDNGVMNSFSNWTFNKNTSTVGFPDLSTWSPSGIVTPNNALLKMDGNYATAHFTGFNQPLTTGALELLVGQQVGALQGGSVDLRGKDAAIGSYAAIGAYDGLTHNVVSQHYAFQLGFDELGFRMANGWFDVTTDGGSGQIFDFMLDRATRSAHFYGPLVFPNAAGTGSSYGVTGAIPMSQGSGTPVKWSSDISGVFGLVGIFGSCVGVTPTISQSAFCFGPSGHIQASWAGDAFSDLVRVNNIPATGITGSVEPAQIDLTGSGLGGLYGALNAVAQYNIPEGGATGAGLQAGPFNDAADNIVSATKPVDLAAKPLGSDFANCVATGTTLNKLVKLSSSAGATCTVIASIADTQGDIGVCAGRCGTTGTAVVAYAGQTSLVMDGATTVNDWVINSPSVAGDGRDTGSTTCPTSGAQVIGRVLSTNGATGTYNVQLGGCNTTGGGGGGGTPGGANGQIQYNNSGAFGGFTASGDFTCVTSTGVCTVAGLNGTNLAALATGLLGNTTGTGVPGIVTAIPNGDTATTQAANSNDTKLATDEYADRVIAKPPFTGNSSLNTVRVSGSDFTSSASAATAITGLSWTLPANTAATYHVECDIVGSEATSATSLTFSFNDVTVAPTAGTGYAVGATTAGTTITTKTSASITATGSTTFLQITPGSAGAGIWVHFTATFEQPSNASTSVFQIEVGVGGGSNVLTIKRDSSCRITQ